MKRAAGRTAENGDYRDDRRSDQTVESRQAAIRFYPDGSATDLAAGQRLADIGVDKADRASECAHPLIAPDTGASAACVWQECLTLFRSMLTHRQKIKFSVKMPSQFYVRALSNCSARNCTPDKYPPTGDDGRDCREHAPHQRKWRRQPSTGSHSSRSIEAAMSVIAIQIEPHRVTRMFFDCCNAAADPLDRPHIRWRLSSFALANPRSSCSWWNDGRRGLAYPSDRRSSIAI